MLFCATAVAPPPVKEMPPAKKERTQWRAQKQHQKRLLRLERRLARTTSPKAKARIQHKITQHQAAQLEVAILSILALIFAFVFPIVGLILAIIARNQGGGLLALLAFWISIVFLILFVIFIILL